jgi:hypothetical protein
MAAKTKQQPKEKSQEELDDEAHDAEVEAIRAAARADEAKIAELIGWAAPKRGGVKVSQARFAESIFISGLGEYLKTIRSGDSDARHRRRYAMELVGPLLWVRVLHAGKETTVVVPVTNLIDLLVED